MNGAANNAANDDPDIFAEGPDLGPDQGEMRERRTAGRSRRRGGSPSIATISWRDIPAQLTARSADDQHKVLLHARFQHAIDRAAAVAGLTTTQDYVQEWRTASGALGDGDVAAQLDQRCAELEASYPRDRLESLVANGGLEPTAGDGRAAPVSDADAERTADIDNSAPTIEALESTSDANDPNDEMDSP